MRGLVAIIVLFAGATFLACRGGSSDEPPTSVPSAPPTTQPTTAPTPDATSNARRSGIQEVDAVIDAVFSRDVEQMRPLLGFQSVACIAPTPAGIDGPPYCLEDEVPGTIVQVLPVAGCEGSWLSSKLLNGLRPLVEGVVGVYAVYRAGDDFKIVFTRKVVPADPSQQPDFS